MISLCRYEIYTSGDVEKEKRRMNAVFEAVRGFASKNDILVGICCLNNHYIYDDGNISSELQRFLADAEIESKVIRFADNPLAIWRLIASSTVMLGLRLHGAITAYLCDVPFSHVEYHAKCSDPLDDIGQDEELRISRNIKSKDEIINIIETVFNNKNSLQLDYNDYIKESVRNFTNVPFYQS